MSPNRRFWLLVQAWLYLAVDVAMTLAGKSEAYWAGDRAAVLEGNPVARIVLVQSPRLFAGMEVVWAAVLGVVVLRWQHPFTRWMAVIVAIGHAVGGSTWLTRFGPWGWAAAIVYLLIAAQFSRWCWQ